MDIEKIDLLFNDICNKKLSGALSPDERNRYYDLVNIDLIKLHAGLPEDYRPGQYVSSQGLEVTFKMSDNIRNFIVDGLDINKNASGYFPYPSNYAAFDYMLFGYIENDCGNTTIKWKNTEAVTGSERAIRLDSHLIPPTMDKPIVRWTQGGWGVDPDDIMQIRVFYLRMPATPFRNYTMQGDKDVYSVAGVGSIVAPNVPSVNPEWPDIMLGDFVIRVCRYAGITLREDEFVQFAQQRQLQGQ